MSLRYALLALLTAGPLTGYDAAKRFGVPSGTSGTHPTRRFIPNCAAWRKTD